MKNRFLHGVCIILISLSFAYAQKSGDQSPVFFTIQAQDTVKKGEAYNEKDTTGNKSLKNRIKPIQANFKRINSVTKWTAVKKKDIEGESAEGGEATFYYTDEGLQKVIAKHYGEIGRS